MYAVYQIFAIIFITALSAGFERISINYHIIIISQNITYIIIQIISLGINSLVGFFFCRYFVFTDPSCKRKKD